MPLHWDAATLADITAWKMLRVGQGAKPGDPFICSQRVARTVMPWTGKI